GNNYQATIPPQPDGTTVYYYARAQDAFNNNTAFPRGSEVWNDSGVTLSQNIGASQTYVVGEVQQVVSAETGEAGEASSQSVEASGLSINKSVFPPIASAGDTVDWTITVSNQGNADLAGFTVTDTIPDELAVVSATSTLGTVSIDAQNVTLTLDSLPAGATAI